MLWYAYKKYFIKNNLNIICNYKTVLKISKEHSDFLQDYEKVFVDINDTFAIIDEEEDYYLVENNKIINNENKYNFNSTIFKYENNIYNLVRSETNVSFWNRSMFSYNLHKLDKNLNILSITTCNFNINDNIFDSINRKNINFNNYVIEDIKYFKTENKIVYGIGNILLKTTPDRLFRVCIVSIDVKKIEIKLIKILEKDNNSDCEKNWTIYKHNNDYFIITNLFPQLIIYKLTKNYNLNLYKSISTYEQIQNTDVINNLYGTYKNLYLTPCQSLIDLNNNYKLIICKKRDNDNNYLYYYCIFRLNDHKLIFINKLLDSGIKKYLNNINEINGSLVKCYGISDKINVLENHKININLFYWNKWNNFGDELSAFITNSLVNKNKYNLVYNQKDSEINLISIGSYIQTAKDNYFIFGSGVRKDEHKKDEHNYKDLNICAVRGPLTKKYLENKGIYVPNIFGDPGLLLPKFYTPIIITSMQNKIGLIPHKTNYQNYLNKYDKSLYYLINPTDDWKNVINSICSCKSIISSSLHGLICSDAYNIPNLWLDEYELDEGDFKFKDYFQSQNRKYIKISNLNEYNESMLYKGGNKINLELLMEQFPFK
jgi:pyruvyltransferase